MGPALGARLPTTSSAAAVLAGDLLGVVVLIAIGLVRHGTFGPVHLIFVTIPFAFGWLVTAIPAGLFVPSRVARLRRALPTVFFAWIGATLIGGAVRSTSLFPGNAPMTFLVVTVVFGLAILLPWRVAVGWWLGR